MDFPAGAALPLTIWTCDARHGVGAGNRAIAAGSAQLASTAWGTANLAQYVPVVVPYVYPVKSLFWFNFATVAGNVDCGLYTDDLTRIVSSGSVAQAGASGIQAVSVDAVLDPDVYYLALVSSSTTATFAASAAATASRLRYMGLLQQATALPLPATATPAANAQTRVPLIGMSRVASPTF